MITEDYVSFEVAKLLKERGFENDAISCINVFKGHMYKIQDRVIDADDDVTIPTIQMAMKFLYKNYGIHITILQVEASTVTMEQEYFFYRIQKNRRNVGVFTDKFKEPEQAANSAIKYILENLI